jgi:GTP-binding protein HflX
VDANQPLKTIKRKLSVSIETIQRIGAHGIPIVTAFNKIDLLSTSEIRQKIKALENVVPSIVPISALHKTNFSRLRQELSNHLTNYVCAKFSIPLSDDTLSFLSWLFDYTDVKTVKYRKNYADITFEAVLSFADKVLGRVKQHGGTVKEVVESNK